MAYAEHYDYKIIFSKNAEKFLNSIDKKTGLRIIEKVKELPTNSKNLDIKKLKSKYDLYRLRVGNFRIIYSFQHEQLIIYVVVIGHRKDVYKNAYLV